MCSNQNLVMKRYDLHPPNHGNLALKPQEAFLNSLPPSMHLTQDNVRYGPNTGQSDNAIQEWFLNYNT